MDKSCNIKQRLVGIDLLKVLAIVLIIINHFVQTLENFVPLNVATNNVSTIFLIFLRHSGNIGNLMFFICSAWFFLDSKKTNYKKLIQIIVDALIISILIFIPVIILRGGELPVWTIIRCFFPTLSLNNWYITCYVAFCILYPFFNKLMDKMTKKQHFNLVIAIVAIDIANIIINFLCPITLTLNILTWIGLYFVIGYIKKYHINLLESLKINSIMLIVSLTGFVGTILLTNFIGLRVDYFSEKVMHWNVCINPFIIGLALSSFNLFRKINIKSKSIVFISNLSMFIYIIHENILLREYYRVEIWNLIISKGYIGYSLIGFTILMTLITFCASIILSFIYSKLIQPLSKIISQKSYDFVINKVFKDRFDKKQAEIIEFKNYKNEKEVMDEENIDNEKERIEINKNN